MWQDAYPAHNRVLVFLPTGGRGIETLTAYDIGYHPYRLFLPIIWTGNGILNHVTAQIGSASFSVNVIQGAPSACNGSTPVHYRIYAVEVVSFLPVSLEECLPSLGAINQ